MKPKETVRRILLPLLLVLLFAIPVRAECVHDFVEKREEPKCETPGMRWLECTLCGLTTDYEVIEELEHEFGNWYVIDEPTCTRDGLQARDCTICGFREEAPADRLGHSYVAEVIPPTCTARGKTVHQCSRCGDRFISDETQPLGHRYNDGVILTEPTENTMGRILFTCIGCGDTYQLAYPRIPFVDVDKNAYYYTSVLWALSNEITTGLDETHFGPDVICNRAQVVTFLWRAAGQPAVTGFSPFQDVPAGCFYEQAVLWAYLNNITTGTDSTHFSPDAPCNRAQVVTFLHRFRGCPEPAEVSLFPDVYPDDFYYSAVLWAARRGITVGMDGGRFNPGYPCTRGQIVTFLYRDERNR